MRRLYFALLSLTIVTSVLKAQTKTIIPPTDSIRKIGKTGETCVPCAAAAKAAVKPKAKRVAPKSVAKKDTQVFVVPVTPIPKTVLLSEYEIIRDSLRLCKISEEKMKDSLWLLERRVEKLDDSLSLPVRILVDTVFVTRTNKKAIVATSIVSGGLGFLGGYFSHSKNIVTSTIVRNNTMSPVELRLRQTESVGVRFALPIGK